ncbi:polymeric immunoglobulin receptor-like isoform X3 [Brienomyrus brachyistius]|uniref:polymeric immunoglobulin receptor-like isoform X2 n=1 Tax=Brienomyrus brachyistius TaxID=42636 RepID=UPI0020B2C9A7|nr:polymeric immunoglobulin receptor-like isoform X2 [Brienomyrus brachyistius]XP_048866152.1 polymeric immunoglobulin receptor-like isoform X2 [Brienomyrus brachyistius]XP_048866154.1 polymeric immunoglobulin receptor-like isoform X3 [Brienomyrus brachyistius]
MDPLMLLFLLIAGLTGADSVFTVGWVTVQRGGSVTIPCFCDDRYKTHVKYWCRGFNVSSCTPIVHTDSPQEGKVSVRDDPDQRVFTVTINNLTAEDSDRYWCGVKHSGASDVGDRVNLSVIDGPPGLSVEKQEVTGVDGDSVSVQCYYGNNRRHRMWCKIGGCCASERSVSLDGRPVLIRDDTVNKLFSVTMSGLERKDTGWYWCAAGILQIPVHITVKQGGDNEKLSSLVQLALYVGLSLLVLLLVIIITWKVRDKYKKNVAGGQNLGRTARKDGRSFGRSDLRRCMKTLFCSWVLTSQLHKVSSCGRFFFAEGDSSRKRQKAAYYPKKPHSHQILRGEFVFRSWLSSTERLTPRSQDRTSLAASKKSLQLSVLFCVQRQVGFQRIFRRR